MTRRKGKYAIAYALRPGQNMVRYSYEVPYPGEFRHREGVDHLSGGARAGSGLTKACR